MACHTGKNKLWFFYDGKLGDAMGHRQVTTTPSDARAALASVMASRSAIRERRTWPLWLSIYVASSFGVFAALRTYLGADQPTHLEILLALACALPAVFFWLIFFRYQGLVVRDSFRWSSAVIICGLFVMEPHVPGTSGDMPFALVLTALVHGMLNSMTILFVWGTGDGVNSLARFIRLRHQAHA